MSTRLSDIYEASYTMGLSGLLPKYGKRVIGRSCSNKSSLDSADQRSARLAFPLRGSSHETLTPRYDSLRSLPVMRLARQGFMLIGVPSREVSCCICAGCERPQRFFPWEYGPVSSPHHIYYSDDNCFFASAQMMAQIGVRDCHCPHFDHVR